MRGTLDGKVLRFERHLRHAIDKVWFVLTDEHETGYWFPGRIVGPRQVGARVRIAFDPKPPGVTDDALAALIASKQAEFANAPPEVFEGTIVAFEPPRLFVLDWAGDTARFELTPEGDATRLVLVYTLQDASEAANVLAGWHISIEWLANRLTPGAPPTTAEEFTALEASYRRSIA
jgi:uncharacterized protein YndB with AHSA1/START domain